MGTVLNVIRDEIEKKLSGRINFDAKNENILVMSLDHKFNLPLGLIMKMSEGDNQNWCGYYDEPFKRTIRDFDIELQHLLKDKNYAKYGVKKSLYDEYDKVHNEINSIIQKYLGG